MGSVSLLNEQAVGRVTRVPLAEALALGFRAWEAVAARTESPSPFMSWAWHRAWADAAPRAQLDASEALLLRHSDDGPIQAILPVRSQRVTFRRVSLMGLTWAIGDVGCPDHLDVLATADADVSALAPALEAMPWRVMILDNLAEHAPNADRLCEALAQRGHVVRREPLWGCPRLRLAASWEDYLATLSSTRRQTVRRKERHLSRDHAVVITDYDEARFDEGWNHLVRLHAARWDGDGGGAFRDPTALGLQRAFALAMATQGRLWLATLDVDGVPVAAWYGFTSADTVYFYQSGREPQWEGDSVGAVLMGAMIRRAIEQGYVWFDFLRGEDAYKTQWTGTQRTTGRIVVFRSGWRGQWMRALDWAATVARG